ncbi:MAG: tyrosine-type recombinase/integrase [Chloroflexi bacterium]|nr:tyrosine-type recombinase/integrase [Chloroflexota bacterium]
MLDQTVHRQRKLDLSTRKLAEQLEVSPALLSLLLNGKRGVSKDLADRMARWLATPMVSGGPKHPATVYKAFVAERASFVSLETIRYYKEKLEPFILWCEKQNLSDITLIKRTSIGEFLTFIRKGRRGKPLSNGALKLHHQTLKTLFNYVGETCGVSGAWANPVSQIKVKQGDAHRTAFADVEISAIYTAIGTQTDRVLKLRNRAIVTVLLNSALRASELLSLEVDDFDSSGGCSVIGKGGKRRLVTIGKSGVEVVKAYLKARKKRSTTLWITRSGDPLTKAGLRHMMLAVSRRSPLIAGGVFAHRFRYTAVTRLLKAGVPLRSVQLYAGHSDPQTTLRYAHAIGVDEAIAAIDV